MKNPKLIVKPFAKNGQKNVIPENYETSMESNQATWDQGFGQITMLPVAAGGLPPKGQDFNGIFNQISENIVYLSQGGRFKFSAEYAEAIGGYPKGAILQSDDEKKEYMSLIDNNKVDFNTVSDISASWKLVNTDDLLAQIASKQPKGDYATKTDLNSGLAGKQPVGDYATKTEVGLKLDKTAVVQTTGSSTTSVMSQDVTTRGLLAKVNTSDVTDSTGTDSVKVMSQKAVTEELNKKFNKNEVLQNVGASTTQVMSQDASTRLFSLKTDLPKLPLIGNGASRSGVTSSRELGVTYTNNRPYSIFVTVMLQSTARDSNLITRMRISDTPASNFYVGTRGSDADILAEATHSQLVLPGERYVVTSSPNSKIVSWVEIAQ